jgi:predicted deacetylase
MVWGLAFMGSTVKVSEIIRLVRIKITARHLFKFGSLSIN